jgi:hypothetical protein
LAATAPLWPPIAQAYRWVDTLTHILSNAAGLAAPALEQAFGRTLQTIGLIKRHLGPLTTAMDRLLRVTRSYRAGLFHCYRQSAIPRTNNDLEQLFGRHRAHERRTTGRKRGGAGTVLHGPVRVIAQVATQLGQVDATQLAPRSVAAWQALRQTTRQRFALRAQGRRFRRDPDAYLAALEQTYLNQPLLH